MLKNTTLVLPVEKLLDRAGNGHTYQTRALILFAIQWLFSSIIFYGRKIYFLQPTLHCKTADQPEGFLCTEEEICKNNYEYSFDPNSPQSLITQFDLICHTRYFSDLFYASFFMGTAVGAYYFAQLQQTKGRLVTLTQSTSLVGIVMMASVLSFNIYINIAAIFLAGFSVFGFMNASMVYYVEISSENLRILGPNLLLVGWSLGQILLSTVLKYITSWRVLSFAVMGAPMMISALFYRFMKDSPRFLVLQERFDEAKASIHNIAKINQRPLPDFSFENEMRLGRFNDNFFHRTPGSSEDQKKNKTMMTLCKYPSIRESTWVLLVFWIFTNMGNHGTELALKNFNDNLDENLLTSGVVELFGYILAAYCCLNFRRKSILRFAFITTGIVYILLALQGVRPGDIDIDSSGGFAVLLLVIGRGAVCIGIGTLYVYITEIYPTSVRHFGFGFFMATSYLSLIFVMNLIDPMRAIGLRPSLIVGIVDIGLILLLKYLPETQKMKLVDYIKEEDDLLLNMEMI